MVGNLPVQAVLLGASLTLLAVGAQSEPWPFSRPLRAAERAPRVLIIGVGGPQVARVAHSLANYGIVPDTCPLPLVPFIPDTASELRAWQAIILGPLPGGARCFRRRQLTALTEYVRTGGGMVFIGGMDSFSGANGSAAYGGTPLAEIMPVDLEPGNDHLFGQEQPKVVQAHPLLVDLPRIWPPIGERNRQTPHREAKVLVSFANDPLLAVREVSQGRTVALLTAWNWQAQHDFTLWPGFPPFWRNACEWAGRFVAPGRPLDYPLHRGGGDAFRFTTAPERPLLCDTEGVKRYYCGTSVEARTLDFIPHSAQWGANIYHFWNDYLPDYVRACELARVAGAKLALFVPQVGPWAQFQDGTTSADNTPYPVPWHRVPDFYNPEWQEAFSARASEMARALAPYRDVVAVLWVTNEPEIYHGWGSWEGPDFCLNTPATLRQARLHAQETYGNIARLNADWSDEGGYPYAFADWVEFQQNLLSELFADEANGGMNHAARRWLMRFVRERWLRDWHATVTRLCREAGLTGPAFGVRHNYNSVPDFTLLPWNSLDLVGKNLYTNEYTDDYVHETWDAFRASGRPVLMSEWGVQPYLEPLGYIGGDEVHQAEQAALGRALAARCPWVVGDIWCNVLDIDFPWGFRDATTGALKPFVPVLAQVARVPPASRWDPVVPAPYALTRESFSTPEVAVRRTIGSPQRTPGVRLRAR